MFSRCGAEYDLSRVERADEKNNGVISEVEQVIQGATKGREDAARENKLEQIDERESHG